MAIDRETLRLAGELRLHLDAHVDRATRELVRAWARTWQTLTLEWAAAYQPIIDWRKDGGVPPTRTQILRAARTQEALAVTRKALGDLAERANLALTQPIDPIVRQAYAGQDDIVWSQLPPGDQAAAIRALVVRVDQAQVEAIVKRSTQRVTSLAAKLRADGMEVLGDALVRGVALGLNPRATARDIQNGVRFLSTMRGGFNIPLHRAMIIARTELPDAHRAAAGLGRQEHADVLKGWRWSAQLDTRTCPSCWAQHGTLHPLEEAGPHDHQQGRCTAIPVTKTWAELGLDIPEPPSLMRNSREVFDRLPRDAKARILGPTRLEALDKGAIRWEDLSIKRRTPAWRDSYGPIPVAAARRAIDQAA